MPRLRTGPIYSQDVLNHLKMVAEIQPSNDHDTDEAVFKEKTLALQRFLHHGMARFSLDTLKHILEDLSAVSVSSGPAQLRSVADLRDAVKSTVTRREAGSLKSSDATAVIYMEHFFFAIYCLTEVKKIFDEIYSDMYFSYYTENDVSRQVTQVPSSEKSEDYSQFGISTLEQMTGSTQHKLRLTVKDVKELLGRWTNLLTEEEPDMEHFDPESEQDLLLVQRSTRMEPLLRLVPDIFAKYYKCLELLKQWWVLAHEIYPNLPFQRRPPSSPEEDPVERRELALNSPDGSDVQSLSEEATLNSEIIEAKRAVKDSSEILKGLEEELEALEKREEKFEVLKETFDKVGEDIDFKNNEKKELFIERERLSHPVKGPEFKAVEEKLRRIEDEIRLLEFQHALLSQDYMIHMEIRPSIIRFHGDVVMRVQEARTTLDQRLETLETLITEKAQKSNNVSRAGSKASMHKEKNRKNSVTGFKIALQSEPLEDEVFISNENNPKHRNIKDNSHVNSDKQTSNEKRLKPVEKRTAKTIEKPITERSPETKKPNIKKDAPEPVPKAAAPRKPTQTQPDPDPNTKKGAPAKPVKQNPVPAQSGSPGPVKTKSENKQPATAKNPTAESKSLPNKKPVSQAKPGKASVSGEQTGIGLLTSPMSKLGDKAITSSPPTSTAMNNKTARIEKKAPVRKQPLK